MTLAFSLMLLRVCIGSEFEDAGMRFECSTHACKIYCPGHAEPIQAGVCRKREGLRRCQGLERSLWNWRWHAYPDLHLAHVAAVSNESGMLDDIELEHLDQDNLPDWKVYCADHEKHLLSLARVAELKAENKRNMTPLLRATSDRLGAINDVRARCVRDGNEALRAVKELANITLVDLRLTRCYLANEQASFAALPQGQEAEFLRMSGARAHALLLHRAPAENGWDLLRQLGAVQGQLASLEAEVAEIFSADMWAARASKDHQFYSSERKQWANALQETTALVESLRRQRMVLGHAAESLRRMLRAHADLRRVGYARVRRDVVVRLAKESIKIGQALQIEIDAALNLLELVSSLRDKPVTFMAAARRMLEEDLAPLHAQRALILARSEIRRSYDRLADLPLAADFIESLRVFVQVEEDRLEELEEEVALIFASGLASYAARRRESVNACLARLNGRGKPSAAAMIVLEPDNETDLEAESAFMQTRKECAR